MQMTCEEIELKEFVTRFRGYDREEVHAFLRMLAAEIRRSNQDDRDESRPAGPQTDLAPMREATLLALIESQRAALASLVALMELSVVLPGEVGTERGRLRRNIRAACQTLDAVSSRALGLTMNFDRLRIASSGQPASETQDLQAEALTPAIAYRGGVATGGGRSTGPSAFNRRQNG